MPSPFPGMDPYLEESPWWELFHDWFVRELARLSLPRASELGCWIDVERSVYLREPSGEILLIGEPDQVVGVSAAGEAREGGSGSRGATALAVPRAVHEVVVDPEQPDRVKQDYLVVREAGDLRRVLAVVEVLSPANKEGSYMPRYRLKRKRLLESRSHFMEIDLLRSGENPSRRLFPELPATPYFVFVARKTGLGRNEEGYPVRLQDPLPVVGLPLGPPRPDLPLDLTAALRSAYDLSMPGGRLRYDRPPPGPALAIEDAAWVRQVLGGGGRAEG
ncbi:MAG: DUF4058 family protein [Planctomycetes bacterium]|nr:DUF4058 family protein [Planctomycetota bacterium]